jgi:hypothetical protein
MSGVITGKHVLWDVTLSVNGVDLSDHVEQLTFGEMNTNKQAAAAMGEIQDYDMPGTIMITDPVATFYQDFAASKVYATLEAAWIARTQFDIVAKASSGAKSATNPEWTIPDSFVVKKPFISGKRGDRHMAPATFGVGGAVTIATA